MPVLIPFLASNPLKHAFKSAGSEGLAGIITSLSLDWGLNTMGWEVEGGYKAPKYCKVSVQFTPIHDITPGLDHNGFNRAPVYRVGKSDWNKRLRSLEE